MSAKKVFIKSFVYSLIFIFCLYAGMLFLINSNNTTQEINVNQEGVAILTPDVDDSKNILIVLEGYENRFFYILNLNAIQNKVSLVSVHDDFLLKESGNTIDENFQKAGIMQSSFDLSKDFGITIDHYLKLDYDTIIELSKDFNDVNIKSISDGMPAELQALLLKSAEEIDINSIINLIMKGENILSTKEGTAFFNELLFFLLRDNIFDIDDEFIKSFKENFSYIQTDINTVAIEKLSKIHSFFSLEETVFLRDVIFTNEENYLEKTQNIYN